MAASQRRTGKARKGLSPLDARAKAIEIKHRAAWGPAGSRKSGAAVLIEPDWRVWLPTVAPKKYSVGFEWFHADFWNWYWPILRLRMRGLPVPDAMPLDCFLPWGRGLAKSSSMEGLALAEGAMIGESFGVYLSSTRDKAQEHLQAIRDLIESSAIARYYPRLAHPRLGKFGNQRGWKADAIYTDGGFAVVSCSLEQGIRGLKDGNRRPSFILLDDIDERDDSPATKREKFEAITQDALPMLAPFGLAVLGQNLIYEGSIADDTLKGKLDWFHGCHICGVRDGVAWKPINTYQDDLKIEKVNGKPVIVAGTPNWKWLDQKASQQQLSRYGERAFMRENQNVTAPDPEERVWKHYSDRRHVITWEQFASVFGRPRIRADFKLYGGYDRGYTGWDRHPGVFSVAAVAPERTPLAGDVFIFYEYVASATEDVGDMAKNMLFDLALLCDHPQIQEAAELVRQSYEPGIPETVAWELRLRAGSLVPFELFNGSHEGLSERRTLQEKWGLPVAAGRAGKTEGLEQLHHYLKPEALPHPFEPSIQGRPNLYLVVAEAQRVVPWDRFGLARHRWEAQNLKWDRNITSRDVPTKLGDDATDATKQYLQTFALAGEALTEQEQVERRVQENIRAWQEQQRAQGAPHLSDRVDAQSDSLDYSAWYRRAEAEIRAEQEDEFFSAVDRLA